MLIKEKCPLNGIEYRFDEVEINGSVESWQACGKLCQQTKGLIIGIGRITSSTNVSWVQTFLTSKKRTGP